MNTWQTDLAFGLVLILEIATRRGIRLISKLAPAFASIFALRLSFNLLGCYNDNSYLTGQVWPAVLTAGVLTLSGTYLARRIVRDGDNVAMWASVVAVMLGTLYGVQDLARRQEAGKTPCEACQQRCSE